MNSEVTGQKLQIYVKGDYSKFVYLFKFQSYMDSWIVIEHLTDIFEYI